MDKLKAQLEFLAVADEMKNIFRKNLIIDGSRQENDAEHSWHLALSAIVLEEYAPPGTDLKRALELVVCHDLVEVYAGDTFCYDVEANKDKEEREKAAADKLFSILPEGQREQFYSLYEEFEERITKESKFANALDRLQPFMLNSKTEGHTWKLSGATREMVLNRLAPVKEGLNGIWDILLKKVEECVIKGWIRKE